jgi:hypothetical protein
VKVDIVIPSYKRTEKLINCVDSIKRALVGINDQCSLYIYFSLVEDLKDFNENYFPQSGIYKILLEKEYKAPTLWNDHLRYMQSDALIYLNDDVLLEKDCILNATKEMREKYPDLDGVIGLNQINIPSKQAVSCAFGLIGVKFANRFPLRQVFCPEYNRFYIDEELEKFAISINKFTFSESSKLVHLHPAFDSSQKDETHSYVRQYLKKDQEIHKERVKKEYLWGKNFNLLNNGNT